MDNRAANLSGSATAKSIDALVTPTLLLDRGRLGRNIQRLAERAKKLGVVLRPHMKTAKSIDVACDVFPQGPGPITVSTVAEAAYFADHGFRDITYAVGISPASARRAMELCRRTGADVKLLLDCVDQADALARVREATGMTPSVLIELDCDDHRGGLRPDDPRLLDVANRVVAAGAKLVGVLAHAGESYGLNTPNALVKAAENERSAAVRAAEILRAYGHACPVVSVGSTPTAHFAQNLEGVTELRAGVYMFFDLVQHGVGVCDRDDLAISVLATVIGSKPENGWVLVDAGWMALSRDRGTANQQIDQGYGVVCDEKGRVLEDVIVAQASQEHGILSIRAGSGKSMPELPLGSRVRILPNHACAMAAQHDFYSVVNGDSPKIETRWERMRGW
ncbi:MULTISPECIES: alanine racemase [unclassified Mesorhizobium]|uniref:alanine racemase n=1 Tax=unclassified Mesorhizobium TaxID=325217 RepID=UPI00112698CE|nr:MULTISPECIES: alanine racemase [unclassified Mesorhizobium]MBZ9894320.1 alanine racemase [Mesorhizobium sp. BR1-1-6]TPM57718.1 DSD1 family PLP-dependent enzyme [Mesorhizobium sp. B2-2-4]TPM65479.1 DSD1 family PLP-dependent enzyme [Mesorhizobium sp. B2-2-1]TPN38611.1 DSD1 family PLP-dependent enzyme [Mesorhizobium sp. B1-1-6]TPN71805.1 DSD1 family PLP-dependent enzyme [Mesorhizobium sp. B1-1-3]